MVGFSKSVVFYCHFRHIKLLHICSCVSANAANKLFLLILAQSIKKHSKINV